MKTTLEIPDELYRAVKAKAATEGRRVTDVVIDGMRLAIDGPAKAEMQVEFPIFKAKKGARLIDLDVKKTLQAMDEEDDLRHVQLMRR